MTQSNKNLHVYSREITSDERTSLSVLVSLIQRGSTVLDLGTGSGALGKYLQESLGCTVDGLTYNEAEADVARPHYRRVEVANLENCVLADIFPGERYDYVVCADVLEHLSRPERIVEACRSILTPTGQLLISVPNAGYSGLIGELLQGDFAYREEGLLDRTHLRFFTRRSLARFLGELNWSLDVFDTITRELPASEFKVAFDSLPPALSRYLLAIPDALTYQFIVAARPQQAGDTALAAVEPAGGAQALFSAQLYLGAHGDYAEANKLVTAGAIGQAHQLLRFTLPQGHWTHLRLDPADRPGFIHLHSLTLRDAQGQARWHWSSDTDGIQLLEAAPHQQMFLRPLWPASPAALVLLHGDDPWVELPVPPAVVAEVTALPGAQLEVQIGWPMSADYLALSETLNPLAQRLSQLEHSTGEERQAHQRSVNEMLASAGQNKILFEQNLEKTTSVLAALAEHNRLLLDQKLDHAAQALTTNTQQLSEQIQAQSAQVSDQVHSQSARIVSDLSTQAEHHKRALEVKLDHATAGLMALTEQNRALFEQNRNLFEKELARVGGELETLHGQHRDLWAAHHALGAERQQLLESRNSLQDHLRFIENSTLFRATRPLVRFKMWLSGNDETAAAPAIPAEPAPQPAAPPATPTPLQPTQYPVDIIVPVYRGLEDTRCCIESVLAYAPQYRAAFRLIAINDASPEPEVTAWLRDKAAQDPRLLLLENAENLGFVGTVNRGMALSDTHDVILLNSDAEVANDWLDRMVRCAWSDARVASVTPFSNNATICSYPHFCQDNALPEGFDTARLDKLFAQTNPGQAVDVPTGVGFCMYIRRDALAEVGLFDVESFGKGYGEENDFCQRAAKAGWRNLHLLDTFVRHAGGVSFQAGKSPREQAAMETLRRLHPDYEREVHAFIGADPARSARQMVDLARQRESGTPVVLAVQHDRAGGTLRHISELARHLQGHAIFFTLTPQPGGKVLLQQLDAPHGLQATFAIDTEYDALVLALRQIGVRHLHYHHLIGHHLRVLDLPASLGLAYDFTAHDFYTLCPQISLTDSSNGYCGEKGTDQCRTCLRVSPAPGGLDIETWRRTYGGFVAGARTILAPSQDVARRFQAFLPTAHIRYAPHTDIQPHHQLPSPQPRARGPRQALKVVVLGALSPIKGADVLEDVAALAAHNNSTIEFHLLGYAYRDLKTQPSTHLQVHGPYDEADLPRLLAELQPDLAWFPAQWPETYSYTLSAALQAGLPIAGPDLGAFPERLAGRPWSWVRPWNSTPAAWLAFFEDVRRSHFADGTPPAAPTGPSWLAETPHASWSYERDYLAQLPPAQTPPSHHAKPMADLMLRQNQHSASAAHPPSFKQNLLDTLVQLRSAPVLRTVARAIPLRWQTRVKNWLRA
jgi:GT2 family glycosyltransferase/2-polyprenyl-3-methyl-5-hydroxy-6-metoxy-1,4-benzoquinol methylase/glycosyltransferase involved in cell wall biosynthesis